MKDWTKNLISYMKNGDKGECPFCESVNIGVENIDTAERKSLLFKCFDCGKSEFFSGTITVNNK